MTREETSEVSDLDRAAAQRNRVLGGLARLREWTLARYAVVLSELDDGGRRRLAVEDLEALGDALAEVPGILHCAFCPVDLTHGHGRAGLNAREAVALDDIPNDDDTDYTTEPRCEIHRCPSRVRRPE